MHLPRSNHKLDIFELFVNDPIRANHEGLDEFIRFDIQFHSNLLLCMCSENTFEILFNFFM